MATSKRTYQDGINVVNGYEINVIRFVGAYQNGDRSRIAAHYWGTIIHPNGDVTDMGDNGMTVTEIKKIVGGTKMTYNRGGKARKSQKLDELTKLKSTLESLGMSTDEVDEKIRKEEEKIRLESVTLEQIAADKQLKKELIAKMAKLRQIIVNLEALDINSTEQKQIYLELSNNLRDVKERLGESE